ncbi:hypothetical protein DAEQUDRAFT_274786 [Daedalea quercina L-15889]|uniref:Uncharacterized protein n=1 Tax=Daedalea quercina L-15889 TaxID=1314783 RepID=A0A165QEA5_9APHY|nr:hypothetical protein DAEQUDRAFT_274786 [Daedalea quercina L-15889]
MLMGNVSLYEPTEERILSWFEQTDTPFDPLQSMGCLLYRCVRCPKCGIANDVPLLNEDGTGYLQRDFRFTCVCALVITKVALASDKFAADVVSHHLPSKMEPDKALAGTLHTRDHPRVWKNAINVMNRLIVHTDDNSEDTTHLLVKPHQDEPRLFHHEPARSIGGYKGIYRRPAVLY